MCVVAAIFYSCTLFHFGRTDSTKNNVENIPHICAQLDQKKNKHIINADRAHRTSDHLNDHFERERESENCPCGNAFTIVQKHQIILSIVYISFSKQIIKCT